MSYPPYFICPVIMKIFRANSGAAMNFFGFPIEIRLKIYSELLVHSEPIVFVHNDQGKLAEAKAM
jgi:hypothetical protein